MKKLLLAIVAVLASAPSFAQYSSGGFTLDANNVYYGVRIGFNAAHVGGDFDLDSRVGMTLGGVLGLRVSNSVPLFLESGLYYAQKGGKKNDLKVGLHYLEIPVLIKYGIKVEQVAILPFFGPYFGFGIAGKTKYEPANYEHSSFSDKGEAYGAGFKRFDMGFKLGCGVEYNMLYGELGYEFGVTDISDINNYEGRNGNFFMNVGINF